MAITGGGMRYNPSARGVWWGVTLRTVEFGFWRILPRHVNAYIACFSPNVKVFECSPSAIDPNPFRA